MPRRRQSSTRSSLSGMLPAVAYHGAHLDPVEAPPVQAWKGVGVTAFVHDIIGKPLPDDYDQCDVLVTDLPWQKGYDTFNQRAGISDGRDYSDFLAAVSGIVESTTAPLYVITGRHALPKLPTADITFPIQLNEDAAVAVGYRPGGEAGGRYSVAPEFLHALAQRYGTVGDFCCGYGRSARVFLRSGKRAVVSDFNPTCIGYISQHATEWTAR